MDRLHKCLVLELVLLALTALGHAQEQHAPGNLLARTSRASLEVVSGRIRLTNVQLGRQWALSSKNPKTNVLEQLLFSAKSAGTATLCYQYVDQQRRLIVDIDQLADLTIDQQPRGESGVPTVRLRQPRRGDLVLTVEDGDLTREVAAASLWHLMLAEPELCSGYLVPILQSLRSDWLLDAQAQRIEAALLADALRGHLPDTAKMRQLVQQLKHAEFSRRQAAHRELRQMGQAVVVYLDRLDERSLDVEQRTRIRQIRGALQINTGDTPARVAVRLADDRGVWLALLKREDVAKRQLAAQHLGAIIGTPLAFAPEASAAVRRGQLHRLRAELGLDRPVLATGAGERFDR